MKLTRIGGKKTGVTGGVTRGDCEEYIARRYGCFLYA